MVIDTAKKHFPQMALGYSDPRVKVGAGAGAAAGPPPPSLRADGACSAACGEVAGGAGPLRGCPAVVQQPRRLRGCAVLARVRRARPPARRRRAPARPPPPPAGARVRRHQVCAGRARGPLRRHRGRLLGPRGPRRGSVPKGEPLASVGEGLLDGAAGLRDPPAPRAPPRCSSRRRVLAGDRAGGRGGVGGCFGAWGQSRRGSLARAADSQRHPGLPHPTHPVQPSLEAVPLAASSANPVLQPARRALQPPTQRSPSSRPCTARWLPAASCARRRRASGARWPRPAATPGLGPACLQGARLCGSGCAGAAAGAHQAQAECALRINAQQAQRPRV